MGRRTPSEADPNPGLLKLRVFAKNTVHAKSVFWGYLRKLYKLKRSRGQLLALHKVEDRTAEVVKNFGVHIRYDSRTGTHNMYREYRDVTVNGALEQMYQDMAARHRARRTVIQIVRVAVVAAKDVRRVNNAQFINSKVAFPLLGTLRSKSDRQFRKTFYEKRPTTVS